MRTVRVYLLLLVLLGVSLGAGFFAADWPTGCARAHWCAPGWPRRERSGPGADTAIAKRVLRAAIVHAAQPPSP